MKFNNCLYYFCIVITLFLMYGGFEVNAQEKELIHLHVLFRHGDRSPISIFPNDTNNLNKWPNGLGQLTKKGMMEHYELGQWLRKKYKNFLPNVYNSSDIYVRSSDYDRCLMSAASNMAGLFMPSESEQFKINLTWLPTPIHTILKLEDFLLLGTNDCPKVGYFRNLADHRQEMLDYQLKHKTELKDIELFTGIPVVNVSTGWQIYDTMFCEMQHNLSQPKWLNEKYFNIIKDLSKFSWINMFYYPEVAKLSGGVLLYDIVMKLISLSNLNSLKDEVFKKINDINVIGNKLIIYSAHDTTVASLLNTLNLWDTHAPPYTATVIVELYKNAIGFYVNILYRNHTSVKIDPIKLTIPGCTFDCPLEVFYNLVKDNVLQPELYNNLCQLDNKIPAKNGIVSYATKTTSYVLAGFFSFAILGVFFAMIAYCYKQNYKSRYNTYHQMPVQDY